MNKVLITLNLILLALVGFLFYLFLDLKLTVKNGTVKQDKTSGTDSIIKTIPITAAQKSAPIVYLNIDTLFEKYEYYKKVSDEANNYLKYHENNYERLATELQTKYEDYVTKAGQGLYTKEQGLKIEDDLKKMKERLDQMEYDRPTVQKQAAQKLEVVQKTLYDFFKAYCKQNNFSCILTYNVRGEGALGINDSLDVTNVIVEGLNKQYRETIKK